MHTVNPSLGNAAEQVIELTSGGVHVAVDALGDAETLLPAILSLKTRGRLLRLGVCSKEQGGTIPLPVDVFVMRELQLVGSFGMQAARYPEMLRMVQSGKLRPAKLVMGTVPTEQAGNVLESMSTYATVGIRVINAW